jgi:type 1 fimbria pilin
MMRKLAIFLGLILAALLPTTAWAVCTGTPPLIPFVANSVPKTFDPTKYNIGDTIWTDSSPFVAMVKTTPNMSCGALGTIRMQGMGTYNSTYSTYSTNIPGIGLRIYQYDTTNHRLPYDYTGWASQTSINTGVGFLLELVKTGNVTSGGAITGPIVQFLSLVNNSVVMAILTLNSAVVVNPTIPTCKVTTPTVQVPLGTVPRNTFTGVGSTSPQKQFSIGVNCSGGSSNVVATMYMNLTDQTNPANVSNTLSLTSDSTAKGVGIQIRSGGTVQNYGPVSTTITPGQTPVGTSLNGTYNIPLTANYVQTDNTVVGGSAKGLATFTMAYQ